MKYKQYQKYKDSGVKWIGEIPEHWKVRKLKYSVDLYSKKSNGNANERPYVGLKNIESKTGKLIPDFPTEFEGDSKEFESGDVLFGKLRPYLAKAILADFSGKCSGEILVLRGNKIKPELLHHLVLSDGFIQIVNSSTYGVKMPRAEWPMIGNILIPISPEKEQNEIYDFLKKETSNFNDIISKSQSQVKLLQEKRQALINHAVTKGLDPTVAMKDSGIEWIGEIPEHWEVRKIKHAFGKIGSGTTPSSTNESYYGDEIHWVNSGDLNDGYITETKHKITKYALDEFSVLKIYPKDTLIIALYGATIGKLGILKIDSTVNQACCAITEPKKINQKFLFYWLLAYRKIIISMAVGGGQPNISQSTITNLRIQTPDFKEQEQIYAFLDKETKQFDNLISKSQSQVKLLQEKRQALITSAVTGKIDVRNGVAA